jgi:hypothetical protein
MRVMMIVVGHSRALELTTRVCVGVPTGHGKSAGKRGYVGRYEDYVRDACDFISKVPGVYLQLPKFLVGFVSTLSVSTHCAFSSDGHPGLFRFSSDEANSISVAKRQNTTEQSGRRSYHHQHDCHSHTRSKAW